MSVPIAMKDDKNRDDNIVGPYHLGNQIGRGYFGVVRKGLNIETGDFVAVKSISITNFDQQKFRNIEREIINLRDLHNKYVVKYINYAKKGDTFYIILEYIENGSLHDVINKFGNLPECLVRVYAKQILLGLKYLHSKGIIHRDLKASNILITKDGNCKIADFGTSLNFQTYDANDVVSVIGSPYWMSPEMIEGKEITFATDIWSFGCTIYELVSGMPPWGRLEPMAALFRIHSENFPDLPDSGDDKYSDNLRSFISYCCQKNVADRPSADDLLSHPFITSSSSHPTLNRIKTAHDLKKLLEEQINELQLQKEEGSLERIRRNTNTVFIDIKKPPMIGGSPIKWVPSIPKSLYEEEDMLAVEQLFNSIFFSHSLLTSDPLLLPYLNNNNKYNISNNNKYNNSNSNDINKGSNNNNNFMNNKERNSSLRNSINNIYFNKNNFENEKSNFTENNIEDDANDNIIIITNNNNNNNNNNNKNKNNSNKNKNKNDHLDDNNDNNYNNYNNYYDYYDDDDLDDNNNNNNNTIDDDLLDNEDEDEDEKSQLEKRGEEYWRNEAIKAKLAHLETIKKIEKLKGEVEYMNSTKKRGFIAAEEYKNIAEEAVLDRKMVLLQLKRVQDQWCPSESFNSLLSIKEEMKEQIRGYKLIESLLPSCTFVPLIFGNLSVDNLRKFSPPHHSYALKQSINFSNNAFARRSAWKTRYMLLLHNFLFYYRTEKDSAPVGILHIDRFNLAYLSPEGFEVPVDNHNSYLTYLASAELRKEALHIPSKLNNFVIIFYDKSRTFVINAQSEEARDQWLSAIDKRGSWEKNNRVHLELLKRVRDTQSLEGNNNIISNSNSISNLNNSLLSSLNISTNLNISRDRNL